MTQISRDYSKYTSKEQLKDEKTSQKSPSSAHLPLNECPTITSILHPFCIHFVS